ncbi:MAG: hypothetical protein GWN06_14685 [Gemmatimonadetes bacterium]|nr:hypothetical protein [Gemmatimonadota bacterium]NIX40421.1 hypothetical protein [Gemmatimonadota bacterium]
MGESVTVAGWVETTRGHGKVAFTVVRDGTGLVQGVLVKSRTDEATWGSSSSRCRRSPSSRSRGRSGRTSGLRGATSWG